jgi:hypothetical protein
MNGFLCSPATYTSRTTWSDENEVMKSQARSKAIITQRIGSCRNSWGGGEGRRSSVGTSKWAIALARERCHSASSCADSGSGAGILAISASANPGGLISSTSSKMRLIPRSRSTLKSTSSKSLRPGGCAPQFQQGAPPLHAGCWRLLRHRFDARESGYLSALRRTPRHRCDRDLPLANLGHCRPWGMGDGDCLRRFGG